MLSDRLRLNLRRLTLDTNISAYSFIWPIWDGEKYITKSWPYKKFLFKKDKIGFLDKFHYPIRVRGIEKKENFIVHHKPLYNNYSNETFRKKTMKWCELQAKDHLVPIEERESFNIDLIYLKKEQARKDRFYKYPSVCAFITFLINFLNIFKKPYIIIQKGFWLSSILSARYTYNVAKKVCLFKKRV